MKSGKNRISGDIYVDRKYGNAYYDRYRNNDVYYAYTVDHKEEGRVHYICK